MKWLGCHVSLKAPRYFLGSIEDALRYQADACMVYTGAPQNSKRKALTDLRIEEGLALLEYAGWSPSQVVVHAPYIINLANSLRPEVAYFGRAFLKQELIRANALRAKYVVLHPGSHLKAGVEVGIQWIIEGLNEVLEEDSSDVMILLETMAGKGSEIGRNFEELQAIFQGVHQAHRLGLCLDTCHLHDAGYDLQEFDALLDEVDQRIGLEKFKVIHINDSKNSLGAHKDRHENIGQGYIGFEVLENIVHNPRLEEVIKILETPFIEGEPPYAQEIEALRQKDVSLLPKHS